MEDSMLEPPRFDLTQLNPDAYRHLLQMEGLIGQHVDPTLYHLIKLRASQINGCAFAWRCTPTRRCGSAKRPSA
jgi:alkylhydroperoxidase family enzyme